MSLGLTLGIIAGGLDIYASLLGFSQSGIDAQINSSRANLIREEAEGEAQRHIENAESFKASQLVAFTKAGVEISGSPLEILDETSRIAAEDVNAIRARGRARAADIEARGAASQARGRAALIGGVTRGITRGISAFSGFSATKGLEAPRNTGLGPRDRGVS